MSDHYIENGHHRYNRNNAGDEENLGFNSEPRLQFGIKQLEPSDAAKLQSILTMNECLKWNVAFRQFWEKRGMPLNPKGFNKLAFGSQGRPKKDNYDYEEDEFENDDNQCTKSEAIRHRNATS